MDRQQAGGPITEEIRIWAVYKEINKKPTRG